MDNQKAKKPIYKKWWFWLIVVIVVFMIIGSLSGNQSTKTSSNNEPTKNNTNNQQAKNEPTPVAKTTIQVSATEISQAYADNEVSADSKYKNQLVEITGIIDTIGKDILGTPYITLKGSQAFLSDVQCMFPDKSLQEKLGTLSKGQKITVIGKVSGKVVMNVLVNDCSF